MKPIALLLMGLLAQSAFAEDCSAPQAADGAQPAKLGTVVYPTAALMDGIEGRGVARVTVDRRGEATNGTILTDQPAGYRFGQAALNALLMDSRFKRGQPGDYVICFDFRLSDAGVVAPPDDQAIPDAPTADAGPIFAIHSPAALKAAKDGTASVVVEIDNEGVVTEILSAEADPAGFQLERAAAVSVGSTKFRSGEAGTYRAKVVFSYAALKSAQASGSPLSLPLLYVPEPDPEDYPTRAASGGAQGVVDLDLEVGADGLLKRIDILRETPRGLGMGLVALYYGNKIIFHPAADAGHYQFSLGFVQRFK